MSKDLPKMYQNKDIRGTDNLQSIYSSLYDKQNNSNNNIETRQNQTKSPDGFTTMQKIYNIFNSKDYIYKIDVFIETEDGVSQKRIVGKNKDYLITMDNEYIPINKIKDIYR